jgi:hypothetical protein
MQSSSPSREASVGWTNEGQQALQLPALLMKNLGRRTASSNTPGTTVKPHEDGGAARWNYSIEALSRADAQLNGRK